jgi:hypothetical protein
VILRTIFVVALCSGCVRAIPHPAPASDAIAQIFGRDVRLDDLVPPSEIAKMQETPIAPADFPKWLEKAQANALRGRVWMAVFEDYMKKHRLEPSQAEIEQCARTMQRISTEEWDPVALGPIPPGKELPLDFELAIATMRGWKRDAALHAQYGGRIIFQQFGSQPVDAWQRVIEDYERKGLIVLPSPKHREVVYDYFKLQFSDIGPEATKRFLERPYCGDL